MMRPISRHIVAGRSNRAIWLVLMAKKPTAEIEDEPGAEDRFLSGVRKALDTPHKPHKPVSKKNHGKGKK